MGFQANVLRVMIASPGDVADERTIVTKEIYRWNDAHSVSRKLILQPIKWQTHSTPQLGKPPQDLLNKQILEDADILIGIFGTRVGTPTENYISGTVEEIKRHVAAGKTAKVYFSDVPVAPSEVDSKQYEALQGFKMECKQFGLYATYDNLDGFKELFGQHLAIELNQPRYLWQVEPTARSHQKGTSFSENAKKVLIDASRFQGQITTISGAEGDTINAGRVTLTDRTARTTAIWNEALKELESGGLIERMGSRPGNYRLTAPGFRYADDLRAEEEEKRQLEIDMMISGTPGNQALDIKANKTIHLRHLEFLTSTGACIADEDLDGQGTDILVPIKHEKVAKLFNSPRSDKNGYDHSGPALVRLSYTSGGFTNSIDLPILLQPVFVGAAGGNAVLHALRAETLLSLTFRRTVQILPLRPGPHSCAARTHRTPVPLTQL